jgi:glycosyltransferase involved in cell wall biosynthesis
MRIAIVGTRGVPNRYGGFEQCAQEVGPRFVAAGHEVTVFNPAGHDYAGPSYRGVAIHRIAWDEARLGPLGLFSFEWLALAATRRMRADVALVLGHTPSGLFLTRPRGRDFAVVTNVDGVERWRSKFGWMKRQVLIAGEARAVARSDLLIADNRGIEAYLRDEFAADSECIEYGASIPASFADLTPEFSLAPGAYDLIVARLEPENNVQTIVEGLLLAGGEVPIVVVGGLTTPYARTLLARFGRDHRVRFVGGIYDADRLNSLRHHARTYYHGHSVGGTNPALLEAMAAGDNLFNRDVLSNATRYFKSPGDVAALARWRTATDWPPAWQATNLTRIRDYYNWDRIAELYLAAFVKAISRRSALTDEA